MEPFNPYLQRSYLLFAPLPKVLKPLYPFFGGLIIFLTYIMPSQAAYKQVREREVWNYGVNTPGALLSISYEGGGLPHSTTVVGEANNQSIATDSSYSRLSFTLPLYLYRVGRSRYVWLRGSVSKFFLNEDFYSEPRFSTQSKNYGAVNPATSFQRLFCGGAAVGLSVDRIHFSAGRLPLHWAAGLNCQLIPNYQFANDLVEMSHNLPSKGGFVKLQPQNLALFNRGAVSREQGALQLGSRLVFTMAQLEAGVILQRSPTLDDCIGSCSSTDNQSWQVFLSNLFCSVEAWAPCLNFVSLYVDGGWWRNTASRLKQNDSLGHPGQQTLLLHQIYEHIVTRVVSTGLIVRCLGFVKIKLDYKCLADGVHLSESNAAPQNVSWLSERDLWSRLSFSCIFTLQASEGCLRQLLNPKRITSYQTFQARLAAPTHVRVTNNIINVVKISN